MEPAGGHTSKPNFSRSPHRTSALADWTDDLHRHLITELCESGASEQTRRSVMSQVTTQKAATHSRYPRKLLILLVGACGFEPQTLRIREYIYQASSELLQVKSLLFLHK